VQGGSREGITTAWTAMLVDAAGDVVHRELRILTVNETHTTLLAILTRDQLKGKRVRLFPPD
jgi:hypothetical protein